MSRTFRLVLAAVVASSAAWAASPAGAERRTEEIDLDRAVAKSVVQDNVFNEAPPKPPPARVEQFVDSHGHTFRVGTDLPTLDLLPYANVLAATVHRGETAKVLVEVVLPEQVRGLCGADAAACYYNDPDYGRGWMYIPAEHPDLTHIIVHEYGHHVDNQLLNLAHLSRGCAPLGDGSRNWLFARNPTGFECESGDWELLLAELYAEDYVSLNGFDGWVLGTIRPPTRFELTQLAFDFANPFWPRQLAKSGFVPRRRTLAKQFTLRHWTRVDMLLTGARRADLDLFLFRRGGQRPLARSIGPGSRELIGRVLRPGAYVAVAHASRAGGNAALRIRLN